MEVSSYLLETEFIRELRDMEMDMLKLQDKITDTEGEKESLLNQLMHVE